MLRIQVMVALQRLVVALGPQSPICYPILLPILQHSTDISQPDELNMLEDGLHVSTTWEDGPCVRSTYKYLKPTRNACVWVPDAPLVGLLLRLCPQCFVLPGGVTL